MNEEKKGEGPHFKNEEDQSPTEPHMCSILENPGFLHLMEGKEAAP